MNKYPHTKNTYTFKTYAVNLFQSSDNKYNLSRPLQLRKCFLNMYKFYAATMT